MKDKTIQWSASPDDKENAQIVYQWLMETVRQESPKWIVSNFVEGC